MKTPLIGIAIGITQIPFLALAQQNSTASSLNEVVVEASKLDKDLFTMTQAATVIEQADIERGAYRGSGSNGTVNRLKDFLVGFMHPLQCAKAGVLHE